MNDSEFDDLLRAANSAPDLPDSFRRGVWNRIAKESIITSRSFSWFEYFTRPATAAIMTVTTVSLGLWLGSFRSDPANLELSYVKSISPFSSEHRK